ncbi:MAG TPA: DegV family protein [Dehalococcoidia bacterium]|nr:DegV family protein [Dehalococcoidia bacterium]
MVKVVTDSVSDIPANVAQELGITVVPEYVCFGTEEYRDGIDLSTDDFYKRLATSPVLPTTSAISPSDILKVFNGLAEETDEIVVVALSSKFGAAYNNALLAKEMMEKRCQVEVIDSLSGIMGLGLIVIAAAQLAQGGARLDEIVDEVRAIVPRVHVRMTFDTLEYLRRGGRIGKAQGLMGSLLKINPILGIKDGEAYPIDRVRGRSKALDYLHDFVSSFPTISSLAVEHATTPDEAEMFIDRLDYLFPKERIYRSKVSPVVGTHVGPRVIAVSLVEGNR